MPWVPRRAVNSCRSEEHLVVMDVELFDDVVMHVIFFHHGEAAAAKCWPSARP
jgi:hypothetical protein